VLIVTGKKQLTREEVVSLMRSLQGDRTAAAFAEELEISPSYLVTFTLARETQAHRFWRN